MCRFIEGVGTKQIIKVKIRQGRYHFYIWTHHK